MINRVDFSSKKGLEAGKRTRSLEIPKRVAGTGCFVRYHLPKKGHIRLQKYSTQTLTFDKIVINGYKAGFHDQSSVNTHTFTVRSVFNDGRNKDR